jgi:anaerobic magnesium-protoporphyrin IX monomethyl ester cyclase
MVDHSKKTSKIILIRGSSVLSHGRVSSNVASPPIGMAYLASYLRKKGFHSVGIIDGFGEAPFKRETHTKFDIIGLNNEEIVERIPSSARIIGFSCMFSNEWINTKVLINLVRAKFPEAVIVLGSEHGTAMSEYVLTSCKAVDYVIRGEGEIPFQELVDFVLNKKGSLEQIGGLCHLTPQGYVQNPSTRNREPDNIPWPAWDLVPINNYLENGISTLTSKNFRCIPIAASRGCPYTCNFCSNEQMWGTLYRMREPEDIVNELEHYKKTYNIDGFDLADLTFITNRNWFLKFAKILKERNLSLRWEVVNTRTEAIDLEVITALAESGCINLCLAPDSGSDNQAAEMDKRVDLNHVSHCIRLLQKFPIDLKINLMMGSPNETHLDIIKTILYGIKLSFLGASTISFFHFVPYPGSNFFHIVRERNQIPEYGEAFDDFLVANIYNELLSIKSYCINVSSISLKMYLWTAFGLTCATYFLFHPQEWLGTIKRVACEKPKTVLEGVIIGLIKMPFKVLKNLKHSLAK